MADTPEPRPTEEPKIQVSDVRYVARPSPDISDALLSFHLCRSRGLGGKLKHGGFLAFRQIGQEHRLAIRKFERIMMHSQLVLVDLPEYRGPV